jgi:hypothetical protein
LWNKKKAQARPISPFLRRQDQKWPCLLASRRTDEGLKRMPFVWPKPLSEPLGLVVLFKSLREPDK